MFTINCFKIIILKNDVRLIPSISKVEKNQIQHEQIRVVFLLIYVLLFLLYTHIPKKLTSLLGTSNLAKIVLPILIRNNNIIIYHLFLTFNHMNKSKYNL